MKKKIVLFLAVLVGMLAMTPVASAEAACSDYHSSTYLHLDCSVSIAATFVNGTNCSGCSWRSMRSYKRFSSERVDILGQFVRNGVTTCRWIITRGSDVSRYAYWHPSYSFNPGCGGV